MDTPLVNTSEETVISTPPSTSVNSAEIRGRSYGRNLDRLERRVAWSCLPVRVHEKDQSEMTALVTLAGSGQIRLRDEKRLLSTGEGNRWIAEKTDPDTAARELGQEMGSQLFALFQELLQKMINDVGASVDDVANFLPYMQSRVGEFLNSPGGMLESRGLAVENLTIQVQKLESEQDYEEMAERVGEHIMEKVTRGMSVGGIRIG